MYDFLRIGIRTSLASTLLFFTMQTFAVAQDIGTVFAKAYQWNPDLNAARANSRAVDEGVSSAKSGYRPKVSIGSDIGVSSLAVAVPNSSPTQAGLYPGGVGLTISQPVYDGLRTSNSVDAAHLSVLASQETLRNTEQNTLLDAVTAHMNVLRDEAVLSLKEANQKLLAEQVATVQDRYKAGEVTQSDVALSQARHAGARSDVAAARANLKTSLARFKQVVGIDAKKLVPAPVIGSNRLPRTIREAIDRGIVRHPAVAAAQQGVEVQRLNVKVIEGELLPSVSLAGSIGRRYDTNVRNDIRSTATAMIQVTVPIYDGGSAYSRTRQAKETLAERRDQVDSVREKVIAAVEGSWAALDATTYQIEAATAQIAAAEVALKSMQDEYRYGQRTLLDVLNAQQELLNARVQRVVAQRDRTVASYALLASVGDLSMERLGYRVPLYQPQQHYDQVRDKWFGTRSASGE